MIDWKNVLIVAAHPDDEVLGVGGTIPLIKRAGGRVTVVIVTDGSTTQYKDDVDAVARKREQARAANSKLGTDELIFWEYPDMRLDTVPHADLNTSFESLITEKKFDSVFVQSGGDINLDHQIVYRSVLVAVRPFPGQPVKSIMSYYVASSTEWGVHGNELPFRPNVYVDIGDTIDVKIEAMTDYEDEVREFPHPRSLRGIRTRAEAHGLEVGHSFAEPFQLLRWHAQFVGSLQASQ